MTHADRAAELRRQADLVESQGDLEARMEAATEAYRTDPTDESKAAYRAASDELREARVTYRAGRSMSVTAENTEG